MIGNEKQLNNLPVGFFDSGVGGLSVYARFREVLPNENTLYVGDLLHLPYGNKTKEELISYARAILSFFEKEKTKAVVIACNTSSAQAYDTIKNEFDFKIYPIIQCSAKMIAGMNVSKIGVFATNATVKSSAYTKELLKYNCGLKIKEIACPNWVDIVENNLFDTEYSEAEIRQHLNEMMKFNPDKIILGCTHYPYLINMLDKYLPKDIFIDPAKIFTDYIKSDLEKSQLIRCKKNACEKFFVTSSPEQFVHNSKIFYELKTLPEVINL